jgi:uncharacterized protein YqeY
MTLIEQIKADQLAARKAYDSLKANLLTTLLGEAIAIGKNAGNRETTDLEVLAIVKKFIDNLDFVIDKTGKDSVSGSRALDEKNILLAYVPTQMTESELREYIEFYIEAAKQCGATVTMGNIMGFLKLNRAGLYDGKMASKLANELLK